MKPKTTHKFYVEWKSRFRWLRSNIACDSIAQAQFCKLNYGNSRKRIIEVVATEKVHEV